MPTIEIGTPAVDSYDSHGYVCGVHETASARSFSLGSGTMRPIKAEIEICFANRVARIPDTIAEPMLKRAADYGLPKISAEEAAERKREAERAAAESRDKAQRERDEANARAKAFADEAERKIPSWAQAVICAEMEQDDCDSMSDYFNAKTVRVVILGFSRHKRDLFPELRKFASTFPETAALATAPESVEHREKYSMGAGYYLKGGSRYSTGWKVKKRTLYNGPRDCPMGEWLIASKQPPRDQSPTSPPPVTAGAMRVEEHTHTKKGFQMHICILPDRVERAEFERLRDAAQAMGGWYSKAWGRTPGGFAFKDAADANAFAVGQSPATPAGGDSAAVPAPRVASPAAKFREMAETMQDEIDHKLRDRLTNTPKRMREAGNARVDGRQLQRTQKTLRALADAHDAGTVPAILAGLRSKAEVHNLARSAVQHGNGYYDSMIELDQPAVDSDAARALWALVGGRSEADKAADDLRRKVEALQFANIPGYFPTPPDVVARMIETANIPAGPCVILEPSAGSGAIVDAIRAAAPAAEIVTCERHSSLQAILKAKGYTVAESDFFDLAPMAADFVLMNPPFENGQDIEHVRRAFEFLKPGGRLVAIMSPGPFFRSDRRATEFRAWFDNLDGDREDIPAGAFKVSGTGVATILVTLDREG